MIGKYSNLPPLVSALAPPLELWKAKLVDDQGWIIFIIVFWDVVCARNSNKGGLSPRNGTLGTAVAARKRGKTYKTPYDGYNCTYMLMRLNLAPGLAATNISINQSPDWPIVGWLQIRRRFINLCGTGFEQVQRGRHSKRGSTVWWKEKVHAVEFDFVITWSNILESCIFCRHVDRW